MLKVKNSALKTLDEKKYFRGELFTGISYALLNENEVEVNRYYQGLYVNSQPEEQDLRRVYSANEMVVDYGSLTASDSYSGEPLNFRGDPYNGLAYDFDDDTLIGKHEYVNGIQVSTISWFKSGEIEHIGFNDLTRANEVEWRKNNSLALASLTHVGKYKFGLECDENDFTSRVTAKGDISALKEDISNHLLLPEINLELLTKKFTNQRLHLSGNALTDELMEEMINSSELKSLTHLILFNVALTSNKLLNIFKQAKLEVLTVKDKRNDIKQCIQAFKQNNANCKVILNQEEST